MKVFYNGKFIITNDPYTKEQLKKHGSIVLNTINEYQVFANLFTEGELATFANDDKMKYEFIDRLFL